MSDKVANKLVRKINIYVTNNENIIWKEYRGFKMDLIIKELKEVYLM